MQRHRVLEIAPLLLLLACNGGDDGDGPPGPQGDDTGSGDGGAPDGGAGDDTGGDGGTSLLPPKPDPFTLEVSGAEDLSLRFDTPTCSKPVGSSNFRVFWRDSGGSHVFVLVAELLGSFTGPGTYDTAGAGAKVKLQEEAGGTSTQRYYATDDTQGDSATITVDYLDEEKAEVAWGEFSFTSLHGSSGGPLTATPQPIPIWCDSLN
ncbi:hypothetical protein L6R53_12415 [Myxococcota bacterium]|nr:hypothetical protein [Myxococcota bacterium]